MAGHRGDRHDGGGLHSDAARHGIGEVLGTLRNVRNYRTLAVFLLAFLACAGLWIFRRAPMVYTAAWGLAIGGEVMLIVGIVSRCIIRSRPPITTPYEAILFIVAVILFFSEYANRQVLTQLGFKAICQVIAAAELPTELAAPGQCFGTNDITT